MHVFRRLTAKGVPPAFVSRKLNRYPAVSAHLRVAMPMENAARMEAGIEDILVGRFGPRVDPDGITSESRTRFWIVVSG
jgi:hypothetical protein